MIINLIAIGKQMPGWVETGFKEYQKRLPKDFSLNLIELSAQKRSKSTSVNKIKQLEGELLLGSCQGNSMVVALDENGTQWPTEILASKLQTWRENHNTINLLVGGPDGLHEDILARANQTWSLSQLTLPHPLVRVIIAEQIYRAYSIMNHHPYHRK